MFSKQGESAVLKELTQIHEMNTYEQLLASNLSLREKRAVLKYLLMITEKQD